MSNPLFLYGRTKSMIAGNIGQPMSNIQKRPLHLPKKKIYIRRRPVMFSSDNIGFIILRHVKDRETDQYWKLCYNRVRALYKNNHIIIIDDNSDYKFVDTEYEKKLPKTTIIKSEYPGRAELLPYYYYLSNKLFDIAVILHDSAFVNRCINFNVTEVCPLWSFDHNDDQPQDEIRLLSQLDNSEELLEFHSKKHLWKGCFGCMTAISHDFLTKINKKYKLDKLLPHVTTRYHRKSLERVIGCIIQKEKTNKDLISKLGSIHKYGPRPFSLSFKEMRRAGYLPIIKIWTGR